MLTRLLIENYALIDHLDIAFPGELVIITGETGAGKSILLGALSLVLGGRGDAGMLHDRSRNCVVEAEFVQDGRETILRRVISPQGRSRAFIDDEPAGVEQMRLVGAGLVDIHSQNQQVLLSDRSFQLSVLDSYASLGDDLENYVKLYREMRDTEEKLAELDARIAESGRERDYLSHRLGQLVQASLKEGELEALEEEQKQLANCESLKENFALAASCFEEGEYSLDARLKEAAAALSRLESFMSGVSALRERVESSRIELKDIYEEIEDRRDKIVYSPERLNEVDGRIALLYELMQKFGADSVESLIAMRDELSLKLGGEEDARNGREALKLKLEMLRKECAGAASRLHTRRAEAASRLSERLSADIQALEMPRASLKVELRRTEVPGPDGCDDVVFLFDANQTGLKELSKVASGGELSRIMLCLKALIARYKGMPTLVFDEIDTGVSGSIADKMGQVIVEMGGSMQVFAITHLPQVACKGASHYLVYKQVGPDGAATRIKRIEGQERLNEIARMLSGSGITQEALANAEVLLKGNK